MLKKCIILLVISVMLAGCAGTIDAPVGTRSQYPSSSYHIVKKGEGLYFISWLYGVDYLDLARWNRIPPPYLIYPGQKIYLKPRVVKSAKKSRRPQNKIQNTRRSTSRIVSVKKRPKVSRHSRVEVWMWPAKGKVIQGYSTRDNTKRGIDIAGRKGAAVIASASGKVVYSGNGLVRYGQMVIIKHNAEYLSAYAHNSKLLVKEGDTVKQGQKIAEMGNTGTNKVMLHFEIRKFGKPVNPLRYLKKN